MHDRFESVAAAMEYKFVIANEHHGIDEEDQHGKEKPQGLRAQGSEGKQDKKGYTARGQGQQVSVMFALADGRLPGAVMEPIHHAASCGSGATNSNDPELQWIVADIPQPGEASIVAQQQQSGWKQHSRDQHGSEGGHAMATETAPSLPGPGSHCRQVRVRVMGKIGNHLLVDSSNNSVLMCTLHYKVNRFFDASQSHFSAEFSVYRQLWVGIGGARRNVPAFKRCGKIEVGAWVARSERSEGRG